jgi:hypothetical protein
MRLGGVQPAFETIPTKSLNRTPQHRSDVAELARMFRYAMVPKKKRDNLLKFLRASVATWGRPDAVHEISTAHERGQWLSNARVLKLNPLGRKQTRKRRADVAVARQFAPHLDETKGQYIPVVSVKSSWESMAAELKLPAKGEAGHEAYPQIHDDARPNPAWRGTLGAGPHDGGARRRDGFGPVCAGRSGESRARFGGH